MGAGNRLERRFQSLFSEIHGNGALESSIGRIAALDIQIHGELGQGGGLFVGGQFFEFEVAPTENFYYLWIKTLACLRLYHGEHLVERQGLSIFAVPR